ncbi:glycoside hydrolase 5 family protein [Actinoallomurus iriomotensis]|uniref:Mannan endo-1,4-beta-mannosidase n=1 Tax=Actinoallomurus iriomotensis TaxID=478107 RepID=A0A9W6VT90_9ACTN|nr:cellulase family glycosylhydrolase [Actinoallomurus iriomotensis]GLY79490.1 mannan endo-1,4-beta-mannosidase [Actinoallomurus iriomotensis]
MHRNFAKLPGAAWLGVNFWSRTGGPLMWRSYDPRVVREELDVLREHGLNTTRSFFYWPDFMPEPDRIEETLAGHYADFLEAHAERGMATIPTFIVGHMSGENWDPAWRAGRDLYADVWMVDRQAWFAEEMARRYAGHPAVAGWLITNEMPIYGGKAPTEQVTAWARLMVRAVRAGGATEPVSIGDGAWGVEVTGQDNGFSVRELAAVTDFVGPHVYRMEDDLVRQHYGAAFICELAGTYGRPVVLEEFGCSSDFVSDDNAAHYYRQVLHNSLLGGATGWLGWNNTDFDLVDQPPYSHHPFELHFGLTEVDGTPKPALEEMRRFGAALDRIDLAACERAATDTALVVPSVLDAGYPFTRTADRTDVFGALRQAYVTARAADLPAGLTRESDGIAPDARLYLVPSAKQLTGPGWHRLEELAAGGAVVYVSYCAGSHGWQRGPWYSHMNAMFGVEHRLRYGLADPIEDDVVELTFTAALGPLAEGTTLAFRAAGTEHSRSYLPVRPTTAEVVAVDGHGRPALLRRRHGEGSLVLCAYPLEHMAAVTPRVNPEPTYRLYDALATLAGVRRPVTVADPRVSADVLVRADGARFAVLVSQADEELKVVAEVAAASAGAEPAREEVALEPYGVHVLELRR